MQKKSQFLCIFLHFLLYIHVVQTLNIIHIMFEKIIKGIKYRLDEDSLTAVVIRKKDYKGNIVIPENVVSKNLSYRVTRIGNSAFDRCWDLMSITIPKSVTHIGKYAFTYCTSLTTIRIPDSVTSIGNGAFFMCETLSNIIFNGTIEQWKNIEIEKKLNLGVPATTVHCSDGDVEL